MDVHQPVMFGVALLLGLGAYASVGMEGGLMTVFDDMDYALGNFSIYVLVKGSVSVVGQTRCFAISQIGLYVRDSYDFAGSQFLGYWNAKNNYVGNNPLRGDAVYNSSFRDYSATSGKGRDYMVYSDIKTLSVSDKFNITGQ